MNFADGSAFEKKTEPEKPQEKIVAFVQRKLDCAIMDHY